LRTGYASGQSVETADVDATRTRWNGTTRQLHQSAANLEMSNYVHHFWLSRAEYTSKKTLFKRIRSIIKTAAFAKEFLEDLEDGAEIYRRIFELESFKWKKEGVTFTLPCCSANVPCQAAVAVSILAFARLLR
jgi:hypothetical protein